MEDAEQQYLYQLESLALHALARCELEIGRSILRDGAVGLDDNPAHFDCAGRITKTGVNAIIAGGMEGALQKLHDALHNFRRLTRTEINAIKMLAGVSPLNQITSPSGEFATDSGHAGPAVAQAVAKPQARFVVFILDEADDTVSYQSVPAADEEAAARQALDNRKQDHDLQDESDDDTGFRVLATFDEDDLFASLRQVEQP